MSQHFGETITITRIKVNYDWRGLNDNVKNYVSTCDVCQRNKIQRTPFAHPAIITDTPSQPNDKIAMDIFGPLPTTRKGNRFILSIQDQLTKYLRSNTRHRQRCNHAHARTPGLVVTIIVVYM